MCAPSWKRLCASLIINVHLKRLNIIPSFLTDLWPPLGSLVQNIFSTGWVCPIVCLGQGQVKGTQPRLDSFVTKATGKRGGKFLRRTVAESSIHLTQPFSRTSIAPKESKSQNYWANQVGQRVSKEGREKIIISLGKPAVAGWGSDVRDTNNMLKVTLSNQHDGHHLTSASLCGPSVSSPRPLA